MTSETALAIIERMRHLLDSFSPSNDLGTFNVLVRGLSSCLDGLEGEVSQDWLEELRSAWWNLEYVNASALSEDRPSLTDKEKTSIAEAQAELRSILIAY